jgi:hypothetical protein
MTSDQLMGGEPFHFKGDVRPRAVVVAAESEYDTKATLPVFARRVLEEQLGFDAEMLIGDNNKHVIPGLADALGRADLLVLSIRRLALPEKDMAALKKYLGAGKPLIAIRTSSHAFDARGKHPTGHVEWVKFDPEVLGGNYKGHHNVGPVATITAAPDAGKHAILTDLKLPLSSKGSLYRTSPLAPSATPLLTGAIEKQQPEPVAWAHAYGKGKVFYTSLGHKEDFRDPQFVRLMHNAARWVTDMPAATVEAPKR